MKRHAALEPFSRDHNVGLTLARALMQDRPDSDMEMARTWQLELKDHFDEEERLLGPLCGTEQLLRLKRDHEQIAALVAALPVNKVLLGQALDRHIRWEENELFPAIEASATEDQLSRLMEETDVVEERRWPHSPKRQELVTKRRARLRAS